MTSPESTVSAPTTQGVDRAVSTIARLLGSEALSAGERSAIRRHTADTRLAAAFWRFLFAIDEDSTLLQLGDAESERTWAALISSMAQVIGTDPSMHDRSLPLGTALATCGWSDTRLRQLLGARPPTLFQHVRRMGSFLASKGQRADWSDVARLLLFIDGPRGETIRMNIARRYYSTIYHNQRDEA